MARTLKVFRTAIGFDDAYVAAPSRKAALAAWGTDKDLFARGAAEEVSDPALTGAPLARPGEVIRASRGGAAENLAALGKAPKRTRRAAPAPGVGEARSAEPPRPPPPKPSRAAVERAEQALERIRTKHDAALAKLAKRKAMLEREEEALRRAREAATAPLEAALAEAQSAYEHQLREWREA